jgi:hypothetical protein
MRERVMSSSYRLHIKVGDNVFEAEGPEEAVRAEFASFKELLNSPAAAATDKRESQLRDGATRPTGGDGALEVPAEVLKRAFSTDAGGSVSLKILPQSDNREADALLLLIFASRALSGKNEIGAVALMAGAKQSGLQLDRVDRPLQIHRELIVTGGQRRGKRYGLNNRGVARATELLSAMFE